MTVHDDGVMVLRGVRDEGGDLADAIIEFANERWRRLLAPGESDVAGRSFRNDFPGLASDRWALAKAAIDTSMPMALVFPQYGDPSRWGEVHVTPLGAERLLVVVREVSGSEEQREALRRSEARFRAAMDRSPDTIALMRPVIDADGRLEDVEALYLNRAALDRWYDGTPLEALAGRRLYAIQPAGRAYLHEIYQQVLDTGEAFEGLRRFESPKGLYWARVRVAATPEGLVHTSQDMTESVVGQEALVRSLRDLEEAQAVGRVGNFELDLATGQFTCSAGYLRLLGFDETLGMPTRDQRVARFDAGEVGRLKDDITVISLAGGGSYECSLKVTHPGGDVRHLLHRGRVEALPDGLRHVSGTAVDVTDLQHAQELAEASQERFAAVVNAVEEAIAIVRPVREDCALADLMVEWANPAWLRRESLEGVGPAGLRGFELHPEFRAFASAIEKVLDTGEPHSGEVHLASGRWLAVSIVRLHDRALVTSLDITERRAAQEADHDRLRAALERAGDAISIMDAEGRLVYVNAAYEALVGMSRYEALGQIPVVLRSVPPAETPSPVEEQLRRGEPWHGTVEGARPDGGVAMADVSIDPVTDPDLGLTGFVAIARDVTEARAAMAQRAQADRLEAVGQLAGGVAHDFNNVLAAIAGYTRFAMEDLHAGSPAYADMQQVLGAADRASALTRQLLAFSRRQVTEPRIIDPAATIEALLPMLRRLIGEHIAIEASLAPDVPRVLIDPGQLDQVVMNLAVNARDAMPDGGRLDLRVQRSEREGRTVARVTVADTGTGMEEHVLDHLFEPFFTTKAVGTGTGLGLATVHGIIQACGGSIGVASIPGAGSVFTIDLPAHLEAAAPEREEDVEAVIGGGERVLVVEDDAAVRGVTVRVLRSLGYEVVEAALPVDALELVGRSGVINLLVSDVRMPGVQGPDLARRLRALHPAMRVLFMSGLLDDLAADDRMDAEVLAKPFVPADLARAARRALA